MENILKQLGLTGSGAKVYLALLELEESTKGPILKRAKIAPSKIYHVLQKLIDKGLVSSFLVNNIKHFRAAPPEQIEYYLEQKKKNIEQQEMEFREILPKLKKLKNTCKEEVTAELFHGWYGMETVYNEIYRTLKKGNVNLVIGASKGENSLRTKHFFIKHDARLTKKGVKKKILFNQNARSYVKTIEKQGEFCYNKRFLPITTPVEINIFGDRTAIVRLKKEPIVFLIHDTETAKSFRHYFDALWLTGIK
jgi:sugar-specific transcriptional regulator TrmB